MKKEFRISKEYGTWYYAKEVEEYDSNNYMYYIEGTDSEGNEWNWSTPYYNEIRDFIKSDKETKNIMIRSY